jgi:hypothetical protein
LRRSTGVAQAVSGFGNAWPAELAFPDPLATGWSADPASILTRII